MMNVAYVMGLAVTLSIILALLGIVLIIIDIVRNHEKEERERGGDEERREEKKSGVGGVVLIGPVPIIFGNDPSIIKWAIVLTIIIVVLFVILTLLPGIL